MKNFHLKQIARDIENGKKEVLHRIDGSYFGTQQKFLEHTIKNPLSSSALAQSFSAAIPENIKTLLKKYERDYLNNRLSLATKERDQSFIEEWIDQQKIFMGPATLKNIFDLSYIDDLPAKKISLNAPHEKF